MGALGAFVAGRFGSFSETPLKARDGSGGGDRNCYGDYSVTAAVYRCGYLYDWMTVFSNGSFANGTWGHRLCKVYVDTYGTEVTTGIFVPTPCDRASECWLKVTATIESTPIPPNSGDGLQSTPGTLTSVSIGQQYRGEPSNMVTKDQTNADPGGVGHWTWHAAGINYDYDTELASPGTFSGFSGLIHYTGHTRTFSQTATQVTITDVYTGTHDYSADGFAPWTLSENWTQTETVVFELPYSTDDQTDDCIALFKNYVLNGESDFEGQARYLDGLDPSEYGLWDYYNGEVRNTGHEAFLSGQIQTNDIVAADGDSTTPDTAFAAGAYWYENGYNPYSVNQFALSISAVRFKIQNCQPAKFTRTCEPNNVRDSATSELLPFSGLAYRWLIPSDEDLNDLYDDIAHQYTLEIADRYDVVVGGGAAYPEPT